ncbi:MAG: phytoene desaturase family protein [Rhizobiaceae bacterium]|nr:phytoene desaturase family protein [Rhizobiaceae bacterium]
MKLDGQKRIADRTIIVGAGMAGLSAAISLASKGENVLLLERQDYPGGKMRTLPSSLGGIDSGPTVFTMKYVFDELFQTAGQDFEQSVGLSKVSTLARHAWDDDGFFDLHASREQSSEEIGNFFGKACADGYQRFCRDSEEVFKALKNNFIGASRPSPFELGRRIGLLNVGTLWRLQPFTSLMTRLRTYFPDPRLQQLFGRYATYVGSSPFQAPATLMLIAHVEQEGVWLINGGMHQLAKTMLSLAEAQGASVRKNENVSKLLTDQRKVCGVVTGLGEMLTAKRVLFCGDISGITDEFLGISGALPKPVSPGNRSLSAITWSMEAKTSGFPLHQHNVLFSSNYKREFDTVFGLGRAPENPTVYVCAQDRGDGNEKAPKSERLMCLINSPANGDTVRLSESELEKCQQDMTNSLLKCGLEITTIQQNITQPADFAELFPGSGGALYGRASHGWMASFKRAGARTNIPGLYLAGGSVHPGAGVPMATLSGMIAAEQMIKDHALI